MSNNIKILFWLYKGRTNQSGEAPLMVRVTLGKQRIQASTGRYVQLKQWDSKKSNYYQKKKIFFADLND